MSNKFFLEQWCNKKCKHYIKYSKSGKIFRGNVLHSHDKDKEDNLNHQMLNNCVRSIAIEDILKLRKLILTDLENQDRDTHTYRDMQHVLKLVH